MVKEAIFLDLPLRCSLVLATKECVSRIFLEAGTNKIHFLRQPPEIWHLLSRRAKLIEVIFVVTG